MMGEHVCSSSEREIPLPPLPNNISHRFWNSEKPPRQPIRRSPPQIDPAVASKSDREPPNLLLLTPFQTITIRTKASFNPLPLLAPKICRPSHHSNLSKLTVSSTKHSSPPVSALHHHLTSPPISTAHFHHFQQRFPQDRTVLQLHPKFSNTQRTNDQELIHKRSKTLLNSAQCPNQPPGKI